MFRIEIQCEFDDKGGHWLARTVEDLLTQQLRSAGATNISVTASLSPPRRKVIDVVQELIAEGDFESLDADVQVSLIRERLS